MKHVRRLQRGVAIGLGSILLVGAIGCASRHTPRDTSVYLLNTDRGVTSLLEELSTSLQASKYQIETVNPDIGVLVCSPRTFQIPREEASTKGEQAFQLRQEGGSVKIRLSYRCQDQVTEEMGPCYREDQSAMQKIARIEKSLLALLNRHMQKKPDDLSPKSKEIGEIPPERPGQGRSTAGRR
jgi:hypothetical protein